MSLTSPLSESSLNIVLPYQRHSITTITTYTRMVWVLAQRMRYLKPHGAIRPRFPGALAFKIVVRKRSRVLNGDFKRQPNLKR